MQYKIDNTIVAKLDKLDKNIENNMKAIVWVGGEELLNAAGIVIGQSLVRRTGQLSASKQLTKIKTKVGKSGASAKITLIWAGQRAENAKKYNQYVYNIQNKRKKITNAIVNLATPRALQKMQEMTNKIYNSEGN